METEFKPYTLDRLARIIFTVLLIAGIVWLLGYLSDVLIPFAVAFLLAYLINPLVLIIQKKIPNRLVAVLMTLLFITALVLLLAWLILPMITGEIVHMGRLLKELVTNSDLAEKASNRLPPDLWQAIKDFASSKEIQDFFKTENFWKVAQETARKILPGVWGVITGTASLIMGLVGLSVIGLYLVFLLLDYQAVKDGWQELLPHQYRDLIVDFVNEFNLAMRQYFSAQAAVAAIVGVLFAIGFTLIGLPLGILLGLFIGLLNMVPYLQLIGLIPAFFLAMVLALKTGSSFGVILGLTALVFIVVQIIQDAVLVPKIMGDVTGLSPAIILLSLSIWGQLLGMFGLLIALPMTCLILAYYKRFLASEFKAKN